MDMFYFIVARFGDSANDGRLNVLVLDTEILQRGRRAASIAEGEGGLFREDGGCRVVNDIGGEGICGLHDRNTVRQPLDRFDGGVI
jgi:hypothetical protein